MNSTRQNQIRNHIKLILKINEMINKYGIFAMLLTISLVVEAKDYYVSNDGNDSFSGTSLSEAFQTLERLNEVHLKPGDKILLKRGDVFMGSIVVNSSGKADAPIIIGAYGIGSNPVIKGSVRVPGIKKQKENTYTFHLEKQVKNLFVNDKMMIPARYPNLNQYLRSDNDKNETPMGMLYDKDLDFEDGYWEGATLVYRGTDWTYDWVTIDKFENNTFYFDSMEVRYRPRKGYGYFIQHKAELLDTINEFFYDKESKTCHFITKDNVSGNMSGVEAVVLDYAILLADGISHVKIENLEFTKFHEAGIIARSNNNFITINNCSIKQIEKVGIWFQDKALKCEISDCVLEDICGRGISLTQSSYNSVIRDKVSRVGLFPGLGTHGVNGMSGIVVEARNERYNRLLDTENFKSDSNYIAYNVVDSCGYTGIRADGMFNIVEYNRVDYPMMKLTDGGGIYCFRHASKSVFRNNIVTHSFGNNTSTSKAHHVIALGMYMDGSRECEITNNTLAHNTTGMVLNAGSVKHVVKNNIFFGNKRNQLTLPTKHEIFGEEHVIKNNIYFCNEEKQFCMIQMFRVKDFDWGTLDSNYYYNPYSEYIIEQRWQVEDSLRLSEWQNLSGHDQNSKSCFYNEQDGNHAELKINDTDKSKEIKLEGDYVNIDNKPIQKLLVKPFSSEIVIQVSPEN